jgi:hypothetical protein
MTLTCGKSSPKDILGKAQRDLSRLVAAEAAQKIEERSDALFDLTVSLTSLKDWLKKHPSATLRARDVGQYWQASEALSAIPNLGKSCGPRHQVSSRVFLRKFGREVSTYILTGP